MAESALLDPSPFDLRHYPAHLFDPDLPLAAGGGGGDDDNLPLGAFDGLEFDLPGDFSVEDFLLRSPDRGDDSGEGSAAGSAGPVASPSSPTTSGSNSAVANGSCEVKHEESDEGRSGADPDPKWSLKRKQASPGLSSDAAKCRRSGDGDVSPSASASRTAVDSDEGGTVCEEEDKRRAARLMRNRESAQLSRQRKKRYVEELEEKVKSMHSVINDLNSRISFVVAENATLRQQLSGGSANCPPPGVYPPPPIPGMPFPWVPGYAMRPHGSHVPLVPIPRLKSQQPMPASKVAKKPETKKNVENKSKTKTKTKKVASVSLLGLLLMMLVFGAFIPGFNHNFGMGGQSNNAVFRNFVQSHARVLSSSSQDKSNLSHSDMIGVDVGKRTGSTDGSGKKHQSADNSSEILPALLYVPRNGKHVKINGNLIIHSVLASEKAVAHKASKGDSAQSAKDHKETSVAIARYLSLPGKDMNQQETSSPDGPLPQWFREGMAGPILNSGMCSEVFQFDISAASNNPGGIIPASPVVNSSSVNATEKIPAHSAAYHGKLKNRRVMYNEAIPLTGKTVNNTEPFNRTSEGRKLPDSKPASSVVVSVLADPREAGNGDGDPRVSPKSLSKIFVVVLVDGSRYVTYSCTLPFKSASPHLVN
uniref:BZIP domain-containing protein n=1 Tax=Leersia perrieri TaxID=77586 RepID=A0A0D9WGH6_9ORYZ